MEKTVKKFLSVFLVITFLFGLVACSNKTTEHERDRDSGRSSVEVGLINAHFEEYAYQREHIELAFESGYVQSALAYGGRIYYANVDFDPEGMSTLVVISINPDGSLFHKIEMQSPGNQVASFNITEDGNFLFFLLNVSVTQQGVDYTAFFVEYDRDGIELTRREFGEFTLVEHPQTNSFTVLNDGRVLAFNVNENIIREIDFDNLDWGEEYSIAEDSRRLSGLFSVDASTPYDFMISDDSYLYGFNIDSSEQTILLNWVQTGFAGLFNAQVGLFDDGRIFVLMGERNAGGEWVAELYLLTPVSRNVMPEVITLTLKGLSVSHDVRQAVALFNRQNTMYRIEIYEYVNQADIQYGNIDAMNAIWDQALLRFQVDLMTGNIPDIVYGPPIEMIDRGLLFDLYPFIDSDPDISRADFFPNILAAKENSDGTLPGITSKFSIQTIMSRKETLGHIEKWTPAEMLSLIHNTHDMLMPFGARMMRDQFLVTMIRHVNPGFIDLDDFTANFDSDEFISLLNTAKLLPLISDIPPEIFGYGEHSTEVIRMLKGEQLLSMAYFYNTGSYQSYADSFDDYFALGIPTASGGVHFINPPSLIGIGISTGHTEAAWNFLRGFLLPSVSVFDHGVTGDIGFSIRKDLFDEMIEEVMTPLTYVNNAGQTVEYPREVINAYDGSDRIEIFAMSAEAANGLRALVESAVPTKRGMSDELWEVIEGDLADFYAGARSAEETAHIIQNRAERWLAEQKLVSGG